MMDLLCGQLFMYGNLDTSSLEIWVLLILVLLRICALYLIPMHGHGGYYDSMWLHDSGPIKGTPCLYTSPVSSKTHTMIVFKF